MKDTSNGHGAIKATIGYVGLADRLKSSPTPGKGLKDIRAEVLDATGVSLRTIGLGRIISRPYDQPTVISKKVFDTMKEAIAFKLVLEVGNFVVDLSEI